MFFEPLEPRQMLAVVTFSNGIVTATGTDAAEDFAIRGVANGQIELDGQSFSNVNKIVILAKGGADTITWDDSGVSLNKAVRDTSGGLMEFAITGSGKLTLQNDSSIGNKDIELRGSILNAGEIAIATHHDVGAFGPFNTLSGNVHLGAGTIVSSRTITGTDHDGGVSTANSGNITINSRQITIDSGSKLLAQVESSSSRTAGSVTLHAEDKTLTADFSIIGVTKNVAKITLDRTVIKGGNIVVEAIAKDLTISKSG